MIGKDILVVSIGILITLVAVIGAFVGGEPKGTGEDGGLPPIEEWRIVPAEIKSVEDTTPENGNTRVEIVVPPSTPYIIYIIFTLSWQDEADVDSRHTNEPDSFSLKIEPPNGSVLESDIAANDQTKAGAVSLTFVGQPETDPPNLLTGKYKVDVQCHNCGDQVLWRPSIGAQDIPDGGNDWRLDIGYQYHAL